jgi:hypothetical protein
MHAAAQRAIFVSFVSDAFADAPAMIFFLRRHAAFAAAAPCRFHYFRCYAARCLVAFRFHAMPPLRFQLSAAADAAITPPADDAYAYCHYYYAIRFDIFIFRFIFDADASFQRSAIAAADLMLLPCHAEPADATPPIISSISID